MHYSFFNLGARWGGWPTPRPGPFNPPSNTRYPLYRRVGGPQGWSGRCGKSRPLYGCDIMTACPPVSLSPLTVTFKLTNFHYTCNENNKTRSHPILVLADFFIPWWDAYRHGGSANPKKTHSNIWLLPPSLIIPSNLLIFLTTFAYSLILPSLRCFCLFCKLRYTTVLDMVTTD